MSRDHSPGVPRSSARIPARAALFAAGLLLGGCAVNLHDVPHPVYLIGGGDGLCGWHVAMDAEGELYSEGGCENGALRYKHAGRASEAERREIVAAFAALPDPEAWKRNPGLLPDADPRAELLRFFACADSLAFEVRSDEDHVRDWSVDPKEACRMPAVYHDVREALGRARWGGR